MRRRCFLVVLAASIAPTTFAQTPESIAPQPVEITSGDLHLKAFLWKPAGPGPFPAVVFNHGRSDSPRLHTAALKLTLEQAARTLGPVFVKHGYVFLFPFRRGEGPSANQGNFIGDLLQREEATRGADARKHLQVALMSTNHLQDARAALSYLKKLSYVDFHRIGIAGHSFGGQLTLLEAAGDSSVRAAVTFGAGAGSWDDSPELRDTLLAHVRQLPLPVMLNHAANDYSLAPGKAIDDELTRLSKPHVLKIYSPFGATPRHGHNFLYYDIRRWERDVFAFLDANVKDAE